MAKTKLTPAEELKALYRRQSDICKRIDKLEHQERLKWYSNLKGKAFLSDSTFAFVVDAQDGLVDSLWVDVDELRHSCFLKIRLDTKGNFKSLTTNFDEIPPAEFWAAWEMASKRLEQVRRQYGNGASGGKH